MNLKQKKEQQDKFQQTGKTAAGVPNRSGILAVLPVTAYHGGLYESVCEKPASALFFALRAAFMFRCECKP
jgi:hypothetical protein